MTACCFKLGWRPLRHQFSVAQMLSVTGPKIGQAKPSGLIRECENTYFRPFFPQKGPSWGLSFFTFLGAEFFRFLGAEFFQQKTKNQKKHSPSSASSSSGPWVCFLCCLGFCFFVSFWLFDAFAHKHQENKKKTKKTQPIICIC